MVEEGAAIDRIAADTTLVVMPIPRSFICAAASYPRVPERETIPTAATLIDMARHDPSIALPGLMMPAQFGPTSNVLWSR